MKLQISAALLVALPCAAAFMAPGSQRAFLATALGSTERPILDPMGLYSENTIERQEGRIVEPTVQFVSNTVDPMGLYPRDSQPFMDSMNLERESIVSKNRQLFDPLGLYPSQEYQDGTIRALEPRINVIKPVLDPLGLYPKATVEVDADAILSEALPFLARPALLDGTLAGDAGFDPLGFAKSKEELLWQRQAELKHSRIAMLAAVGWPLSELFHTKLAAVLHLQPLLVEGGRVPSLLNGGLGQVNPFFWMGILAVAGLFEGLELRSPTGTFDPLGLYPADAEGQRWLETAELKNGRLAMAAITAFAAIEAITHHAEF